MPPRRISGTTSPLPSTEAVYRSKRVAVSTLIPRSSSQLTAVSASPRMLSSIVVFASVKAAVVAHEAHAFVGHVDRKALVFLVLAPVGALRAERLEGTAGAPALDVVSR